MRLDLSAYLNICGVNPKDHGVKQELVTLFCGKKILHGYTYVPCLITTIYSGSI